MQHQEISLLEALSESSNVKGVLAQVPESMDLNSASSTVSVQSDNSHFSTLISDTFLSNGIPETVGLSDILSSAHKAPDISAGLETFAAGGDTSSIHNPGTVIVVYINTMKTSFYLNFLFLLSFIQNGYTLYREKLSINSTLCLVIL